MRARVAPYARSRLTAAQIGALIAFVGFPLSIGTSPPYSCVPVSVVRVQLFGDSTQVGYDGTTLQPLPTGPAGSCCRRLTDGLARGRWP